MEAIYISASRLINEDLPIFFRRSLPAKIADSYLKAKDSSQMNVPEFYLESLSMTQGIYAQDEIHALASAFENQGVTPTLMPNARNRAHLEILTNRTLLTVHRVRTPGAFPTYANYRESNAAGNQLWLTGIEEPQAPEDARCNIHILHGPSEDDISELGFVQLAIPEARQRHYLSITNLFSTDKSQSITTEEVTDDVIIHLRKTASSKTKIG